MSGQLPVEELILALVQTTDPRAIEGLADRLGDERDRRAIRPLLVCLSDPHVQEAPDVEYAVCRALSALGVMRCSGARAHSLRPRRELPDDVVDTIREVVGVVPWQYFGTAKVPTSCRPSSGHSESG